MRPRRQKKKIMPLAPEIIKHHGWTVDFIFLSKLSYDLQRKRKVGVVELEALEEVILYLREQGYVTLEGDRDGEGEEDSEGKNEKDIPKSRPYADGYKWIPIARYKGKGNYSGKSKYVESDEGGDE